MSEGEKEGQDYPRKGESDFQDMIKEFGEPLDDWSKAADKEWIRVWKKKIEGSPFMMIRAWAKFKDVKASCVYNVLQDATYRRTWDPNMLEGSQVEVLDDVNEISYYAAKSPGMIGNRDFLTHRSWKEDKENDVYVILSNSVEHPNKPPQKGFIRGHAFVTAYYLKPDPEDPNSSELWYTTQTDPKGWIPAWLVNKLAGKIGPSVIEKLYKASQGYDEWAAGHYTDGNTWDSVQKRGGVTTTGDETLLAMDPTEGGEEEEEEEEAGDDEFEDAEG